MQSEEQRETQEKAHDEFMGGGGGPGGRDGGTGQRGMSLPDLSEDSR